MLERLTDAELAFMEDYYYSIAMAECLFSDYDNLSVMEDEKLASVRFGQYPLISHEYILDHDTSIDDKRNFALRKGAGDVFALGGRLFGKTHMVEKVDFCVSVMCLGAEKCGFSSYDAIHIRGVLEDVVNILEHHPIMRMLEPQISRSPNYRLFFKTGYLLESVNMNVSAKNPGKAFFQKHFTRLYIEEASMETEEVYRLRRDSVSELGCVYRVAGMTNFTKYSPCGRAFYEYSNRGSVVNLPQYVNPRWGAEQKEKALKDFGGEASVGYRIFIKGEVVEDGVSVFDMARIRPNYDEKRNIKTFEVTKAMAASKSYEHMVVVEKPKNATETYICADIGESAPTEAIILFKIGDRFRYEYNITLFGLTDDEQYLFFKWLGTELEATVIGLDCTDGTGRAIIRALAEVFPVENLQSVSFNAKLPVEMEKNPNGDPLFKDGKPVYKEEYISEWSVKNLKDILYGNRIDLPMDHKFDQQINSVIAVQSGSRITYPCVAQEDHLYQAFQVFSITLWLNEFLNKKNIQKKKHYIGFA